MNLNIDELQSIIPSIPQCKRMIMLRDFNVLIGKEDFLGVKQQFNENIVNYNGELTKII